MSNAALFLSSTPLHSLWSLGIATGAMSGRTSVLAMIDQRPTDRDFIAEAAAAQRNGPFAEVLNIAAVGKRPHHKLLRARRMVAQVGDHVRRLQPDYIAVGNDRRAEFYAALAAAPGAVGAYIDDGTASYIPWSPRPVLPVPQRLNDVFRHWIYGVPVEHPEALGSARAVSEAWLALPEHGHLRLAGKTLRTLQPAWFRSPAVREICALAIERAGMDAAQVSQLDALLVLPHASVLRADPALRLRLERLALAALAEGRRIAIKRHPRARELGLELPAGSWIEIPRRLPLEILAPLLRGTRVVGSLTSGLLYLKRLGASIEVQAVFPRDAERDPVSDIYRRMGIEPLAAA